MKYVLLTGKHWHDSLFDRLKTREGEQWHRISTKADFNPDRLKELQPNRIFIPHWSHIIPATIYSQYECIVFHMTDLPFGRGGSPLQNLIVRGYQNTMISAIQVSKGIDTGKLYLKAPLSLHGTAQEIFLRSSGVIESMIDTIIEENTAPTEQTGEVTEFKRRTPEQSNIAHLESIEQVYDYIRMLDCEGYPNAYIETPHFKFEFTRAAQKSDRSIVADVRIIKK